MAVPSGYVASRSLDPNAQWDAATKTLKVLGQTYKPGQYYQDTGGKTYIQQPTASKGAVPVRSIFGGGANYDAGTGNIGLPGGVTLGKGQYENVDGKAYAQPAALEALYRFAEPAPITQEKYDKNYGIVSSMFSPGHDLRTKALDTQQQALQGAIEANAGLVNSALDEAVRRTQMNESGARKAAMQTISANRLASSPAAFGAQAQVSAAYAPEYSSIENQGTAQMANLAAQANQQAAELRAKGMDLEAGYYDNLANNAWNLTQGEQAKEEAQLGKYADYFAGVQNKQAAAEKQQYDNAKALLETLGVAPAQIAGILGIDEGTKTADMLKNESQLKNAKDIAMLDWTQGPTPYQQDESAREWYKINNPAPAPMSDASSKASNKGTAMQWVKAQVDQVWADPSKGAQWLVDEGLPWIDGLIAANAGQFAGSGLDENDIVDLRNYARKLISANIPALGYPASSYQKPSTSSSSSGGGSEYDNVKKAAGF